MLVIIVYSTLCTTNLLTRYVYHTNNNKLLLGNNTLPRCMQRMEGLWFPMLTNFIWPDILSGALTKFYNCLCTITHIAIHITTDGVTYSIYLCIYTSRNIWLSWHILWTSQHPTWCKKCLHKIKDNYAVIYML